MKKILLYGINYAPELTGIGKYTGEMAEWWAGQGYGVTMVTAPPYYPEWQVHQGYSGGRFSDRMEGRVRVLRCPLYVPRHPSALKRILHLLSFSFSSCFALLKLWRLRPDLIVYVVPTLFCALQILLYARLSGARVVLHVQDFEVDALFGLGMARPGVLARFAYRAERWLMRRFDRVSTISTGMRERARDKGVEGDRLVLFPNWSELGRFQNVRRDADLLTCLGVDPARKVVLYSGNMGEKQGLGVVLEAARELADCEDIQFLLVGEGGGKAALQAQASVFGLTNVRFAALLPYEQLPALLASADCHLVVQRRGVADAVLPSKLTNILAVGGNAVITADADTTLGRLCDEHAGIAVLAEPESSRALVAGIRQALSQALPNEVACGYARDFLDKNVILERFLWDMA